MHGLRRVGPQQLALPVALVALLIASTGVTPADAVRAVKRAAFASNAGAVNGIKASRKPQAGKLLPLGPDGRFGAEVLPSLTGARGPRGPEGPAGPRGPSGARVKIGAHAMLGYVQGVETTAVTLGDVVPGSYLVLFTGVASARVANVRGYVTCRLRVNGEQVAATDGIVGETAGSAGSLSLALQHPLVKAATFNLSVTCLASEPSSGEGFRVYSPTLTALKLDTVTLG